MTTATLTRAAAAPSRLSSAAVRYTDTGARCALGLLTPGSYGLAAVIVVLTAFLAWTRREAYRPLFTRTTLSN